MGEERRGGGWTPFLDRLSDGVIIALGFCVGVKDGFERGFVLLLSLPLAMLLYTVFLMLVPGSKRSLVLPGVTALMVLVISAAFGMLFKRLVLN